MVKNSECGKYCNTEYRIQYRIAHLWLGMQSKHGNLCTQLHAYLTH